MFGRIFAARAQVSKWPVASLSAAWRYFRFWEKQTLIGHRGIDADDPTADMFRLIHLDGAYIIASSSPLGRDGNADTEIYVGHQPDEARESLFAGPLTGRTVGTRGFAT